VQQRTIIRNVLKVAGILGFILFLVGIPGSYIFLGISLVALFLGVTDFGRQCPLFLSVKQILYRIRSKQHPPII